MEENDTAMQLLKLREWQLEKHGKRFKRQRLAFAKSPASAERTMAGRQRNSNNSPGVIKQKSERMLQSNDPCNYSLEKQPSSQNSYASSIDPNPSPISYKELPAKDNYSNVALETSVTTSAEPQYMCAPAAERGNESSKASAEQYTTPERSHLENDQRRIESDSQFESSYTGPSTIQLQTPSLVFEAASTSQVPNPVNEEENLHSTSEREIQTASRPKWMTVSRRLFDIVHESVQYLELEPAFKSQGSLEQIEPSRSRFEGDASTQQPPALKRQEVSEVIETLDSFQQCKTVDQPTQNPLAAISKTALEPESVSADSLQEDSKGGQSIQGLQVNASSSSLCLPETATGTSSTSTKMQSAEILQPAAALDVGHDIQSFSQEGNYRNISREEPSYYNQDYTAKPSKPDVCENEILPDYSANPLPYLHKKFHHDQERKVAPTSGEGQNADLHRYIHNFQSLLVSRLNGTFSTDVPFNSRDESLDFGEGKTGKQGTGDLELAKPQRLQHSEYVCEVCKLECTDDVQLSLHYRTHEQGDRKNFTCQFCKCSFFMKSSKDRHERKHMGKKIYRCSQCQQVFNKAYILNRHRREVHAVKRPFKCEECGKDFTTSRNLQNHVGIHQEEKHHKCTQCEHTCHTASGLRTHIMEAHSGTRDRSYTCQECGEKFAKQYGLKRHMERKHTDERASCNICLKSFACNEDLIKHTKSHESKGKGDLSCEFCDQTFTSAWSLQRHSKKHQSESQQFKCSKCPKSFTRKDSLLSHEKLHAQKKNYVCKCGKRFVKKSQLTAHEDKHSNVPKYSCDICKHSYKFKVSLRNHSCKPKVAAEDAANAEPVDACEVDLR
ncbi:zinc finger protein 154-like [Penaeus japonicus]|uniref:zinc finger protein 154-like n=1 Tax=Penaeus japonicus TaxID=27405 RepID=UPI001C711A23|nr:zinc finger protein 154-like [Penaeus japonicus]